MPSSRYPSYLPALASRSIFRQSLRPCAQAVFTSRSGSMCEIASRTASATPPETAKPRPAAVPSRSGAVLVISAKLMPFASNMPMTSSNVRTKSTSLRTLVRMASSFFALHGPMNATFSPGCCCLQRRAVSTMGVSAMEMQCACSGKSFFAISAQLGQQDVAMNGCSAGTFFRKSFASSSVQRSAPTATSATWRKPSIFIAALSLSGVIFGPSWPTNAGATIAMTFSPPRSA